MPATTSLPNATDHPISLATAIDMTTLYRANREAILATTYQGMDILPLSETFNRDSIDALLSFTGCAGIRIYYGMDENKQVHVLLVGVNISNEDLLPAVNETEEDEPEIIERGQRCPPACPPDSPLNT